MSCDKLIKHRSQVYALKVELKAGSFLYHLLGAMAYRGGWFGGGSTPLPRNSKDIGGVLDRMSKKNQRLDFLL